MSPASQTLAVLLALASAKESILRSYEAHAAALRGRGACPANGNDHWNSRRHRPRHACPAGRGRRPPAPTEPWRAPEAALRRLRGTRIGFLGDSLPWQASHALSCALEPAANVTIAMYQLHVVPIDTAALTRYVSELARASDALVVSLGTWYTVAGGVHAPADPGATGRAIAACPDDARDAIAAKERAFAHAPAVGTDFIYELANLRRHCRNRVLNGVAFASDLARLRAALAASEPRPRVVWKDVAPQHFANAPSGDFGGISGPRTARCGPVGDAVAAKARNLVADRVLLSGRAPVAAVARTWNRDSAAWDHHVGGGDCTHFCNPSTVTWGWVQALVPALAEALTQVVVTNSTLSRHPAIRTTREGIKLLTSLFGVSRRGYTHRYIYRNIYGFLVLVRH